MSAGGRPASPTSAALPSQGAPRAPGPPGRGGWWLGASPERQRLRVAVAASVTLHALLLSLNFGGQAYGLPGFRLPWQERRASAPDIQIFLVPAPRAAATPSAPPAPAPQAAAPATPAPRAVATAATPAAAAPAGPPPQAVGIAAPAPATTSPPQDPVPLTSPPVQPSMAPTPELTPLQSPEPTTAVLPPQTLSNTTAASLPLPSPQQPDDREQSPDVNADAARIETERLDAIRQLAIQQEADRQVAALVEAARREAELAQSARQLAAQQEAARQAASQAEASRQEAQRAEAARQLAAQQEAERQAAAQAEASRQEAQRAEAARQLAAQQEAERQAAAQAEASRQEAQRAEAARQLAAQQDASRQAAAQADAARQAAAQADAARLDAERAEAARLAAAEARREARLREIGRQLNEEADIRDASAAAAARLPPTVSGLRRARLFGRTDPNAELVLYAEAWARKIQMNMAVEQVRDLARHAHTTPMVTVAIRSDGSVESVKFVLSSGVPAIDEAIVSIVRSQAPYQPFQPELARDVDVVEIRRSWHFDVTVRLY